MKTLLSYIKEGRNYIIALALVMLAVFFVGSFVVSPVGGDLKPVIVVIPKGATASSVGAILDEKGLIRFPWAFTLVARANAKTGDIKPGAYELSRKMSVREILDVMTSGKNAAIWVTIPEGTSLREIADRLHAKHLVDRQSFIAVASSTNDPELKKIVDVPEYSFEGYLFPDTYLIRTDATEREIVKDMLKTFRAKVSEPLKRDIRSISSNDDGASRSAAMHRIITVASLIEEEAQLAEERPIISAVIWNRLRLGMKLDIDATVIYALGGHRTRLYYKDLKVESPYNTYKHSGLPPGPISNPGLSSIKAAIYPAKADYLYYVANGNDGSHTFSRTLAEHNAAVRRIRNGGS